MHRIKFQRDNLKKDGYYEAAYVDDGRNLSIQLDNILI